LLGVISLLALGLSVYAVRHRKVRGAAALAALTLALAVWTSAFAVELEVAGFAAKLLCTKIVYLGVVSAPVAWLVFAARYARRDGWLGPLARALLLVVPLITLALAWTNEFHGLIWRSLAVAPPGGRHATLVSTYGPWFFVHTAYSYALLLAGSILLLRGLIGAQHLLVRQTVALLRGLHMQSSLCVPLVVRERIFGTITLTTTQAGWYYDQHDLVLAEELARRAALAVENAQLYQHARRRGAELATVQQVAQAINSSLRLEAIFQTIVSQIAAAFGYQMVSIYLRDGDALHLQAYVGYDDVMTVIRLDQGVSGRVARTGEPNFVRDQRQDPDFLVVAPGTEQAIIVPLKSGDGEVLGTLAVESTGTACAC
jgi:putative methionine-R-sulfoxide reductase with GAF domain